MPLRIDSQCGGFGCKSSSIASARLVSSLFDTRTEHRLGHGNSLPIWSWHFMQDTDAIALVYSFKMVQLRIIPCTFGDDFDVWLDWSK